MSEPKPTPPSLGPQDSDRATAASSAPSRRKRGGQPGNQNFKGHRLSEKSRQAISAALAGNQNYKGHRHSEKSRQAISAALAGNQNFKGHRHSEKSRQAISAALAGNQNAKGGPGGHGPSGPANGNWVHGGYAAPEQPLVTIEDVIADLVHRQKGIAAVLDQSEDVESLIRAFTLYSQNASRLGRLLRDQRALSGAAADGIAGAIAQALDEINSELGVDV